MIVIEKALEVEATLDGDGNLFIIQRNDMDDDDIVLINKAQIEAFILGLQEAIKDGCNG